MADAKIINYGQQISAGSTAIPDNTSEALDIESTDGGEYITINTTDGGEQLILGVGPTRPNVMKIKADDGSVSNTTNVGWYLDRADPSATNPVFVPKGNDPDTGIGHAADDALSLVAGGTEAVQLRSGPEVHLGDYADDAGSNALVFKKSRSATTGTAAIVSDDDVLGAIEFKGADSAGTADSNFAAGAKIFARVNGTPGDGDMPTELVFCTTPDGAEAAAERMYIFENGSVGIGDTGNTSKKLSVTGDVRFSANVLGGSFSDVSDSSWKVDPNSQTTSAKLAGPIALAAIGSEPASIVNCAQIYAKDVSTSAEMFVVDEAGNETQLSPHNFEMFTPDAGHSQPWSYTSKNAYIGKEVGVDMFGLVKAVEELSGKTLMFERDLPDEEIKDWYVEQGKIQAARETAITEWDASKAAEDGGISSNQPRPEPYTIKDPPAWLKSRLKLGNG